MFWETIKQILKKNIGTCIIVEEGKPSYVVVPFEDYEKLLEEHPVSFLEKCKEGTNEQEILEKINQEITNWKASQAQENPEVELAEENEVKVEDLPII